MKQSFFILAILVTIFSACGPSPEKLASDAFSKAQKLYEAKQFNETKLLLDSIIANFPGQIEFVTRSKDMLRKITVSEQEQNLVFLDSLLKAKQEELEPLMKNFIVSDEYGAKKVLIHKRQKPENSYNRTYIKANLDIDGNFYISSNYCGTYRLHHDQVKVYNKDQSAITEKIPADGFLNRSFEDGGTVWEIVSYKNGKDNGVIDFIAANYNKPLKVQFIGKKYYYIVMEKFDKEAIRDANEISFVLKEITRIKQEIKNTKYQLSQLKPKA